jgi:ABC-type bacteriocin/lantibiotic exporter with double-glycine peptidase domain
MSARMIPIMIPACTTPRPTNTSTALARAMRAISGAARFAVLGLACAACASSGPRPMLSSDAKILDLPFVEQDQMYECGLVSITALCKYWNVEIPPAETDKLAQMAREREGLSGGELREALGDLGFDTFLFRGQLGHGTTGLFTHVDAHRPPLVLLSPEPDRRHYVLFMGYDEERRETCLLDPVRGRVLVPYETFEKSWSACNHFTLLAVPRESAPPPELAASGTHSTHPLASKGDRP